MIKTKIKNTAVLELLIAIAIIATIVLVFAILDAMKAITDSTKPITGNKLKSNAAMLNANTGNDAELVVRANVW